MMNDKQKENYIQTKCDELKAALIKELAVDSVWPKKGDEVWRVTSAGKLVNYKYRANIEDEDRNAFLGLYKTKEKALKVSQEVRELAQGTRIGKFCPRVGEIYWAYRVTHADFFTWGDDLFDNERKEENYNIYETKEQALGHKFR